MKRFTTGEVARILKFSGNGNGSGSRQVAKMIDNGDLKGEMHDSSLGRRRTRKVRAGDLIKYMEANDLSLESLEKDTGVQRLILNQRALELKEAIARAKKRGDIFLHVKASSEDLAEPFMNWDAMQDSLGSLDDLRGIARNASWAKVFRKMADIIDQHTRMCIANSKK